MAVVLQDVKDYITATSAGQWSDDELTAALAAEQSAQSARVRTYAEPRPADLDEALKRRVARNLSMRKIPLGLSISEADQARVGSVDPEIRRLEGPYRRLIVG